MQSYLESFGKFGVNNIQTFIPTHQTNKLTPQRVFQSAKDHLLEDVKIYLFSQLQLTELRILVNTYFATYSIILFSFSE